MNAPWLSVILPTYNGQPYLAETLASIECQAEAGIEVLAVDDGSRDETLTILQAHAGRLPLRLFARPRVGNWVANTNYGLAQARGRYVCFLHQDDLWLPGRLRALRGVLERDPGAALVLSPARYIDAQGRPVGPWRSPLPAARRLTPERLTEALLVQNFLAVPAPVFTREAALRVGGLDESLWYTADWDFWLKLAATEPAVYQRAPSAAFRVHALSQTAQGAAVEMRRQIAVVLERHLPGHHTAAARRAEVAAAARLSMEVNHALAACAGGRPPLWKSLAREALALRPAGWYRFWRDSRLAERVMARVRARRPLSALWHYLATRCQAFTTPRLASLPAGRMAVGSP